MKNPILNERVVFYGEGARIKGKVIICDLDNENIIVESDPPTSYRYQAHLKQCYRLKPKEKSVRITKLMLQIAFQACVTNYGLKDFEKLAELLGL